MGFAADDQLRESSVCNIAGDSRRWFSVGLHASLGENLCQ